MTKHLHTKKNVYSVLLILVMICGLLPVTSLTAYGAESTKDIIDPRQFHTNLKEFIEELLADDTVLSGKVILTDTSNENFRITHSDIMPEITKDLTLTFSSNISGNPMALISHEDSRHMQFIIKDGCTLTLVFEDVILDGNNASGGIEVAGGGTLKLVNANIRNCQALNGGAVRTEGNIIVEDSQFADNKANLSGGGIYANKGADIKVSQFTGNEANIEGGGLSVKGDTTIRDSLFEENTAGWNGGAINSPVSNASIEIIDSSFIDNTTLNGGGAGGAISGGKQIIMGGSIFSDNTIWGNKLNNGGALYTTSDLIIDGGDGHTMYITSESNNTVHANGNWGTHLYLIGSPTFLYIEGNPAAMHSGMINNMEGKYHPDPYTGENVFAVVGAPKVKLDDTTLNISGLADIELLKDYLSDDDMIITVYDNGTPLDVTVKQTGSTATADLSGLSVGTHIITVTQTLMSQYDSERSKPVSITIPDDGSRRRSSSSSYTVRFDSNGGSTVDNQTVARNSKVSKPTAPTRDDYKFTGWYTDSKLTSPYDFDKAVTSSFTLYAGWEAEDDSGADDSNYDHPSYISGDPSGTFRPDATLTRAEAASLLYNLAQNDDKVRVDQFGAFSDVDDNAWYYTAVGNLSGWGVISGYSDTPGGASTLGGTGGSFRPDATITRAEFVTMAARFAGISSSGSSSFSDVPSSHWASGSIAAAVNAGYVSGYPDTQGGTGGTFRPESTITRAEAVTILNKTIGCDGINSGTSFRDVPSTHWAYRDITAAATEHDH